MVSGKLGWKSFLAAPELTLKFTVSHGTLGAHFTAQHLATTNIKDKLALPFIKNYCARRKSDRVSA
jgi:hypothetical protein